MIENKPIPVMPDIYREDVQAYARLGYSPKRIAQLLGFGYAETIALCIRINTKGDLYNDAYTQGYVSGEHDIDTALMEKAQKGDMEAITLMAERSEQRKELELRNKLFGV